MNANILIPSYCPSQALVGLVASLISRKLPVVVVNDGSPAEFDTIFETVERLGAKVLHHDKNSGKGGALKTGIAWMKSENIDLAVTADADGQHTVADICKVASEAVLKLAYSKEFLILGSRFGEADRIPWKSKIGNALSSVAFFPIAQRYVRDTQTGLRAIPSSMFDRILGIKNNGYSLESKMLVETALNRVEITELDIETVYHDPANSCSHFNPISDSLDVYWVFVRYSLNGLLCYLCDLLIFSFLFYLAGTTVLSSNLIARISTFPIYFINNRVFVFKVNGRVFRQVAMLIVLIIFVGAVSSELQQLFHLWLGITGSMAKILVELLMFPLNFLLLRRFIFTRNENEAR